MKFQNGALKQEKASWGIVQNLLSRLFKSPKRKILETFLN
ncbi:unnamed protein product [Paramecium sonneborni]|uniref:Uncharacterized protein n=1 Tax=Paramecium sonneborni TaxID=65129 RepID=A0A8S1R1L1_9CILI|nr:unnamed protein product [Paramecium sonneborni]